MGIKVPQPGAGSLCSMTGFGRAEVALAGHAKAVVEVRSVNHRFLEVECRLPEGFQTFEEALRGLVRKLMRRGQVRVSVSVKAPEEPPPIQLREEVARRYAQQLKGLEKKLGLKNQISLALLLGLPHVVAPAEKANHSTEKRWAAMAPGIDRALAEAVKMRRAEGKRLKAAIGGIVKNFETLYGEIKQRVPVIERQLENRLTEKIEKLLSGAEVPEHAQNRSAIVSEAAALVQNNDVSEELARLGSHLTGLKKALDGGAESPGRTMEFLAQELHREVNTLGTKIRDAVIVHWVVDLKGQIEKLREQAANLE